MFYIFKFCAMCADRNFVLDLPTGSGANHLDQFSTFCQAQGAELEVEKLRLEMIPIRDADIADGGLTHYAIMPVPDKMSETDKSLFIMNAI